MRRIFARLISIGTLIRSAVAAEQYDIALFSHRGLLYAAAPIAEDTLLPAEHSCLPTASSITTAPPCLANDLVVALSENCSITLQTNSSLQADFFYPGGYFCNDRYMLWPTQTASIDEDLTTCVNTFFDAWPHCGEGQTDFNIALPITFGLTTAAGTLIALLANRKSLQLIGYCLLIGGLGLNYWYTVLFEFMGTLLLWEEDDLVPGTSINVLLNQLRDPFVIAFSLIWALLLVQIFSDQNIDLLHHYKKKIPMHHKLKTFFACIKTCLHLPKLNCPKFLFFSVIHTLQEFILYYPIYIQLFAKSHPPAIYFTAMQLINQFLLLQPDWRNRLQNRIESIGEATTTSCNNFEICRITCPGLFKPWVLKTIIPVVIIQLIMLGLLLFYPSLGLEMTGMESYFINKGINISQVPFDLSHINGTQTWMSAFLPITLICGSILSHVIGLNLLIVLFMSLHPGMIPVLLGIALTFGLSYESYLAYDLGPAFDASDTRFYYLLALSISMVFATVVIGAIGDLLHILCDINLLSINKPKWYRLLDLVWDCVLAVALTSAFTYRALKLNALRQSVFTNETTTPELEIDPYACIYFSAVSIVTTLLKYRLGAKNTANTNDELTIIREAPDLENMAEGAAILPDTARASSHGIVSTHARSDSDDESVEEKRPRQ